jgi:1,4-dihydroxy-2-naphthoate octaprenyltransferase
VVAALLGATFIQVGTNLANDYFDFKKGADTDQRLGPARVTQKGWVSPAGVAFAAGLAFGLAVVAGVYLVSVAGLPVVGIGVASILSGVLYTGGPWPLGYLGLGDLFVFVFFGPVAVCGTYFVQAGSVSPAAMMASIPVGLLATAILVVNNLRDRHTDVLAGKRTLVVRFGPRVARAEYVSLALGPYALLLGLVVGMGYPAGWLLPCLSVPLAVWEIKAVSSLDGAALNPHLGGAARLGMVFGLLLAIGVNL